MTFSNIPIAKPNPNDLVRILSQHKKYIFIHILILTLISGLSYLVLPRTYKVAASISLQTQYFQLPLVSGFLPETLDPQEIRAKREALMHLALNQQFLGQLAERYHLIEKVDKNLKNNPDLELLSKKFEIISNGNSAFNISFVAKNPNLAFQVLQDFITHLQEVMTNERHTLLLNLHDAIQEQLEGMSINKQGDNANAIFSVRPDLLQRQMEKIQEEIETLKNAYSEKHPRVTALKDQLVRLSQWNKTWAEAPNTPRGDAFSGIKVDDANKELFDDLLKKYRYLEVVIYMDQQNRDHYISFLSEPYLPQAPTWPKLPILIVWGIVSGFLVGAIRILLKELPRSMKQHHFSIINMNLEETTP